MSQTKRKLEGIILHFALMSYRDEIESLQILLSRTQAGPGRTVKQEQEEISPDHVQRLDLISVFVLFITCSFKTSKDSGDK